MRIRLEWKKFQRLQAVSVSEPHIRPAYNLYPSVQDHGLTVMFLVSGRLHSVPRRNKDCHKRQGHVFHYASKQLKT
jgi:hypothetical protein